MTRPDEDTGQRLAAALRAQASVLPGAPRPVAAAPRRVPAWALLVGAVLLGGVAGLLAALVSTL